MQTTNLLSRGYGFLVGVLGRAKETSPTKKPCCLWNAIPVRPLIEALVLTLRSNRFRYAESLRPSNRFRVIFSCSLTVDRITFPYPRCSGGPGNLPRNAFSARFPGQIWKQKMRARLEREPFVHNLLQVKKSGDVAPKSVMRTVAANIEWHTVAASCRPPPVMVATPRASTLLGIFSNVVAPLVVRVQKASNHGCKPLLQATRWHRQCADRSPQLPIRFILPTSAHLKIESARAGI